jgi:hypothetical protein
MGAALAEPQVASACLSGRDAAAQDVNMQQIWNS